MRTFARSCATASAILLAVLVAHTAAMAGPVVDLSRSGVDFGPVRFQERSSVQPVFVTNTGDAPLLISAATLSGPHFDMFQLAGTCTPGVAIAPGGRCRLDLTMMVVEVRGTSNRATLTLQTNASPPIAPVILAGSNNPNTGFSPPAPTPEWIDFGTQPPGTAAAPRTITIRNKSTVASNVAVFALVGNGYGDFSLTSDCPSGMPFPPGASCTATLVFTPIASGPRSMELALSLVTDGFADGTFRFSVTGVGGGTTPPSGTSAVVEFYNAALDHYFITWVPDEIAKLDAGTTIKGWTRTGQQFKAYTTAQAGTTDICRIYIIPERGDSHFFGRGTKECNDTMAAHPDFILEDPKFMALFLPVQGICPAGTTNIYRVFSARSDANHRYMVDRTLRDQMAVKGWSVEGDGPELVVMCAP